MTRTTMELSRSDAETFLYKEAQLIDTWQLEKWAALFTPDGEYLIPPLDQPESDPQTALFFVYDDRLRLAERARRLLNPSAHAEFPRSKVRHLVSNVNVEGLVDGFTRVTCNFVVFRSRHNQTEVFPGHAIYDLSVAVGEILIRRKRAMVDTDTLRAQGRISLIL